MNRLYYWLENGFLKGIGVHLLTVLILIVGISFAAGFAVHAVGGQFDTLGEAVWWAFLRLTDPGYLGDDEGLLLRTVSTLLTVLGYVLFLGALVAILTTWMNDRFERLRQGRSPVIEKDHLVVLGWSSKVPAIVRELALYQKGIRRLTHRRKPRVVVLLPRISPDEVDRIAAALRGLSHRLKLLLRAGNQLLAEDLERIRVHEASSVVIPAYDAGPETTQIDTRTLKTLLALEQVSLASNRRGHRSPSHGPHIVIELTYALNRDLAEAVIPHPDFQILPGDQVVSRLIAQTLRHPGLSKVFLELLTHHVGYEVYVVPTPRRLPEGTRFHQLLSLYREALPIGVKRAGGEGGRAQVVINPNPNVALARDDQVVVLSRSPQPRTQRLRHFAPIDLPFDRLAPTLVPSATQHVLILGWSSKATAVLRELETHRFERFAVTIVSRRPSGDLAERVSRYAPNLKRVTVEFVQGDTTLAVDLERIPIERFDRIVLLATDKGDDVQVSDARTVMTYIRLKDRLRQTGQRPKVVIEVIDPVNKRLFGSTYGEEVVVSNEVISHLLAQILLKPDVNQIFETLLTAGGPEFFFHPATRYFPIGSQVDFEQIARRVFAAGETAIGIESDGNVTLVPQRSKSWRVDESLVFVVIGEYPAGEVGA